MSSLPNKDTGITEQRVMEMLGEFTWNKQDDAKLVLALINSEVRERIDKLLNTDYGIYPKATGNCGVCGQRRWQHTCDQMLDAVQSASLTQSGGTDEHR